MTHPFTVLTYVSADPGCPEPLRAVAHCFEVQKGGALRMLPATQLGPTAAAVRERMDRLLEAEVARERAKLERPKGGKA